MNFSKIARLAVPVALLGLLAVAPAFAQEAAAPAAEAAAAAPTPPVPNKGDTTWMLISSVLVLLMTVPGLALFYGGLVRSKNMLSVLSQILVIVGLVAIIWVTYGYSLAFTDGGALNSYIGGFSKAFLAGVDVTTVVETFSRGVVIPELVFVLFQMTFACITPALIVGAIAERIKFSSLLVFVVLWVTFVYFPMAHMVWWWPGPEFASTNPADATVAGAGLIWGFGAIDFAGGTVVHINAGIAGLIGALLLGPRIGYGREVLAPVGGLVRLQRRFEPRSQRLCRSRLAQHLCCDRRRDARLAVHRVDRQGQAEPARCGFGRRCWSRRDYPGRRLRRPDGLDRARPRRRRRLLLLLLGGEERSRL
jgi:Amt family ammonium transporter